MNSPRLWTRIDAGEMGRRWVDAFLARSKTTPIHFTNFCMPTSPKDVRLTITEDVLPVYLERMQALILRQRLAGPPHPAVLRRAPLLEVLTLFGDFLTLSESGWQSFEAPRLRHIQVLSCSSFPWKSLSLVNISSLCLVQNIERLIDQEGPDVHEFASALRSMYRLERLCLEETLPSLSWAGTQQVDLPRLQALRVHGQISRVVEFLAHLRPRRLELDVACREIDATDGSCDDLSRLLAASTTTFDEVPLPVQAASITSRLSTRSPWIYVHVSRVSVDQDWEPPRHYPREYFIEDLEAARRRRWKLDDRFREYCDTPLTNSFSLTLSFPRLSQETKEVINRTLGGLPLRTAQLLIYDQVVDPQDIFATDTIDRPFTFFHNVKHLRIARNIFAAFIRALNAQDMPKLEHIYFPDLTPTYWQNVMGSLAKLNAFVSDRDKMGRRIRSLYLRDKDAHLPAWRDVGKGGTRIPARLAHIAKEIP